jgi:hypothetical protein
MSNVKSGLRRLGILFTAINSGKVTETGATRRLLCGVGPKAKPTLATLSLCSNSSELNHMDISELLDVILQALCYLAGFGLLLAALYFAYRSHRSWLRIVLSVCCIFRIAIIGLALWFDFYLLAGSTMRHAPIYSPDRKHVVLVSWTLSGAIGFDHVHVRLRSRYSPFAKEVFTGMAQSPPDDPEVVWTDDHHILISYWKDGVIKRCDGSSQNTLGVDVMCRE